MRVTFPKFLKQNPSFLGLDLFDLLIIGVVLLIALLMGMTSIEALCLILFIMALLKWLRIKVPKGAFEYSLRRKEYFDYAQLMNSIKQKDISL